MEHHDDNLEIGKVAPCVQCMNHVEQLDKMVHSFAMIFMEQHSYFAPGIG